MKVHKQGGDVRKWFGLFDEDRNLRLDLGELSKVLLHAGVRLGEREIKGVMRLLDRSGNGKIS